MIDKIFDVFINFLFLCAILIAIFEFVNIVIENFLENYDFTYRKFKKGEENEN